MSLVPCVSGPTGRNDVTRIPAASWFDAASRYRLGSRLTPGSSLNLSVEGARTQQDGQAGSNEATARLGWRW